MNNAENDVLKDNNTNEPKIVINMQYIKDLSFENPNAPMSISQSKQVAQKAELSLDLAANKLQENIYEIILDIGAKVHTDEFVSYQVELKYGAVFTIENIPDEHLSSVLFINCPSVIFPFARRVVADATRDGGFPPLMIEPVDFVALYNKRMGNTESQI